MIRKDIIFIIFFFTIYNNIYGQGYGSQMLYFFKPSLINPAMTGQYSGFQIKTGYSKQLVGIDDGPLAKYLGAEINIPKNNIACGLNIFQDENGPLIKSTFEGVFAYRVNYENRPINVSKNYLSMGLTASINQYRLKVQQFKALVEDPILYEIPTQNTQINTNFGIYYVNEGLELGVSAFDLIISKIKNLSGLREYYTQPKFLFLIAYESIIVDNLKVKPSIVAISHFSGPFIVDLNLSGNISFEHSSTLKLGFSYRNSIEYGYFSSEEIIGSVEIGFKELLFGYQYNMPISKRSSYLYGSHYTGIGLNINSKNTKRKHSSRKKNFNNPKTWF